MALFAEIFFDCVPFIALCAAYGRVHRPAEVVDYPLPFVVGRRPIFDVAGVGVADVYLHGGILGEICRVDIPAHIVVILLNAHIVRYGVIYERHILLVGAVEDVARLVAVADEQIDGIGIISFSKLLWFRLLLSLIVIVAISALHL